jgi:hypothetical protein
MALAQPQADRQGLLATLLEQAQRYEQQGNKDIAAQFRALAGRLK